jgi:ribosome-associated translation inhibitor RaiA
MIQIKFKNLAKSDFAHETTADRIEGIVDKFPDLRQSRIIVTLEMENSPVQAGPDQFKVKIHLTGGRYAGITVEKTNLNLYVALADVVEHMLETLNRFGDKARVKERRKAREISENVERLFAIKEQKTG